MSVHLRQQLQKAFETLISDVASVVVDLQSSDVNRSVINGVIAKTQCKSVTTKRSYPTLIAQLVHLEQCWNMFMAYEQQHGMKFDKLVYLRPDATWIKPVQIHSDGEEWPATAVVTNAGGQEWAAFGPRSTMYHWFNRLTWHKESCNGSLCLWM
eukprot:TRINITY_DN38311_c0_g1_i1.p1 TRINITY_DN38311_c0_g1~~TRINITY_DN38311_c0_g1_i1.p1  ORF type:complete len:162 (-),score=19.39 TRINITY_DN38311_c0_g1_i1:188-649(-)